MDPVTIAILAGSTALNMGAGGAEAKANAKHQIANMKADYQQLLQDQEEARRRNEVLARYRDTARGFANENQGYFTGGMGAFQPVAQEARMADAAATRGGIIADAIGQSPGATQIAFRAGAPETVRSAAGNAIDQAFATAHDQGGRLAGLGAYGDTQQANLADIVGTGQNVETVNTLARGNAALLPHEQELAGFQARSPIFRPAAPDVPSWVPVARGVAQIGSAIAGGRMAAGGGGAAGGAPVAGYFGGSPSTNPLLNPSTYGNYV